MNDTIKSMQLYPRADRVLTQLRANGVADQDPLSVSQLSPIDQLHYHGTDALDAAIGNLSITAGQHVLEIGSGWGGCARYIAQATGARVNAVELQRDYNDIGAELTRRTGLNDHVTHMNADFLQIDLTRNSYDHAVSWLALFHIPDRPTYLSKIHASLRPYGGFYAEDLYLLGDVPADEVEDFRAHLFPNSLVRLGDYQRGLDDAGFADVRLNDMTEDWTAFTKTRLSAFHQTRDNFIAVHGLDGFRAIDTFYTKMAGYFERGIVGGVQVIAQKGTG